jgi:hypothetical protein
MRRLQWILVLCFVSGCKNRYYEWAASQFEQVKLRGCPHTLEAYVQSEDRYNTFNVVGHYDILWYAYPVMEWHMEALQSRAGLLPDHMEKISRDTLADQEKSLIFYLLMSDDTEGSLRPQLSVQDQLQAKWSITLVVGKRMYEPVSIRRVRIPSEMMCLFGNRYDPHYRLSYKIVFQRYDEHDDLLEFNPLRVELKSVNYNIQFTWEKSCVEHHCKERAWLSNLQ